MYAKALLSTDTRGWHHSPKHVYVTQQSIFSKLYFHFDFVVSKDGI